MSVQLTSNAYGTLASGILAGDLTLTLNAGAGAKFPLASVVSGKWFYPTIFNSGGVVEIVKCTDRTGDVLTITRAQDGTAASAFILGDSVEVRPTAATHNDLLADIAAALAAASAASAAIAPAVAALLPATTKVLFPQAAAPVGWTKDVVHNDKALRVVSGAGAGSGGTVAFSTVFGKTATDSHTLITAEIPAHAHGVTDPGHAHGVAYTLGGATGTWTTFSGGATALTYGISTDIAATGVTVNSAGGGGGHTHGMDIRVQYVDTIIATKN